MMTSQNGICFVFIIFFGISNCKSETPVLFPVSPSDNLTIPRVRAMAPELMDEMSDNTTETSEREFVVKEVPSCITSTNATSLCDVDEDYNEDIEKRFAEALENSKFIDGFSKFFSELLPEDELNLIEPMPPDVRTRFGDGGLIAEEPVCASKEKIIYPKRGATKDEEWVFLLNQGDRGLRQGIRVEECANEGSECSVGKETGIATVCRQKYIYKKMLAMDRTGSTLVPESILVPSCCSCYSQSVFTRFGRGDTSSGRVTPAAQPNRGIAFPSSSANRTHLNLNSNIIAALNDRDRTEAETPK